MAKNAFGKKETNLITYKEASIFLNLSIRALSELVSNELIPFKKEGHVIYFDKDVLEKWKNSEKDLVETSEQDLESLIFCSVLKATAINKISERPLSNVFETSKEVVNG
jgi:hypothetical protein